MARIVHFEIHADDMERAAAFYTQVFDWKFTHWEGPMEYWLIETGPESEAGINGGLMRREVPVEGQSVIGYVCTVDVPDIDQTIDAVQAAGGNIHMAKSPVPGVGWMAYFTDTEGNRFGAMQSDTSAA